MLRTMLKCVAREGHTHFVGLRMRRHDLDASPTVGREGQLWWGQHGLAIKAGLVVCFIGSVGLGLGGQMDVLSKLTGRCCASILA